MTDTATAFAVASVVGVTTAALLWFGISRGLRAKRQFGARFVWMLWTCGVAISSVWFIGELIGWLAIGAAVQRHFVLFWLVWLAPSAFVAQRGVRLSARRRLH